MNIFVTGGSGFVGRHLIPLLVARGHHVVALARSPESARTVEALGAASAIGDLNDAASLDAALAGGEVVVHLAAAFEMWADDAYYESVNIGGTSALLGAAGRAGVQRFIYISAASVIAGGVPAHNVDETYQPRGAALDAYSRTKAEAEARVLAANRPGFTTIALRPPLIWGRGHSMIDSMRTAVQQGRWMWIGGGAHRLSTVHVDNLCAAVVAALTRGRGGEAYFITDGEARTVRHFLTAWLRTENVSLRGPSIPAGMAFVSAGLMARVWRTFRLRGAPPVTPAMVNMLGVELSVSDRKAREQLGYRPGVSIDEGLAAHRVPEAARQLG